MNPSNQAKRRLTSRDVLRFQMVDDPQVSPDGVQVAWVRTWLDAEENRYRARIHVTDLATGATRQLTNGAGQDTHPAWSPDGRFLAYLATPGPQSEKNQPGVPEHAVSIADRGPQLMVVGGGGGVARPLTNLRGGARAPAWSPDGTRIAFNTFVDPAVGLETSGGITEATDDPYVRYNRDVLVVNRVRWQADSVGFLGNYRSQVAWVRFDPENLDALPEPVLATNGEFDLSAPVWSPDGRTLATTGNLRPGGELVRGRYIYLLDAAGVGLVEPRELFGLEEMRSNDLAWSPDGRTLAVCGHDDPVIGHYGNQMLWLIDVATGTGRCVTQHIDRALGDYSRNYDLRRYGGDDGPRWLPGGEQVLVLINEGGSVDLAELDLGSGQATMLTQGRHSVFAFAMDSTGARLVLAIGDDVNPCDLFVLERKGASGELRRLTDVNRALLDELELTAPERFWAQSGDVRIDSWLLPPVDREPGKRYPVILYTGGGPGGMRASVFCHEFHLYAAHGYVVVHCNTRGNHGYGQDFSLATRGKWGDLDYEDNMACLRTAIAQYDFVDPERMAVAGGSYGGYMATWIIGRHPEFKAAVVDRSLVNRLSFTGDMGFLLDQTEFDKRMPWEDLATYVERSPLMYVGNIRTPTLVVHSAEDRRCPIDQGEQLFIALQRVGVPTEFVRFPNESHELSRSGRPWHRVFRLDRYLDWFARWLT
jgi:dipeptidyl aminopeptidase/acylaminoacyl peptidase